MSKEIMQFSQFIFDPLLGEPDIFRSNPTQGLEVYRNNFLYTMIAALGRRYVSVLAVLGENNFNFFARKYIYKNLSKSANLNDYGESFQCFLAEQPESEDIQHLESLAGIDNLWYNAAEEKMGELTAAQGMLILWQGLVHGHDVENLEISEAVEETISVEFTNGEVFLITNK